MSVHDPMRNGQQQRDLYVTLVVTDAMIPMDGGTEQEAAQGAVDVLLDWIVNDGSEWDVEFRVHRVNDDGTPGEQIHVETRTMALTVEGVAHWNGMFAQRMEVQHGRSDVAHEGAV